MKRTWFSKDTQQWVSELPRAFWLGIYDRDTKKKIYSDDDFQAVYLFREVTTGVTTINGYNDARKYFEKYESYPVNSFLVSPNEYFSRNFINYTMTLKILRPKDTCIVMLLPNKETGEWSFVNVTKGHICPCKFKSLEEALEDLENYKQKGKIISYEKI